MDADNAGIDVAGMEGELEGNGARAKGSALTLFGLLGFYGFIAAIVTWPVVMEPTHHVLGDGELGGWLWRYWLMKLQIGAVIEELKGEPLKAFFTIISLGRFPETGNVMDLLAVSLPLEQIFGHPGYYNAKVVFLMITDALAGYALCHYLTKDRINSAVAGAVFGFNSFVFYEVFSSGLRQAAMAFIPLFALYLEKALREGRFRHAFASGFFLAMTAIFYWFNGLFLGLYALGRVAYHVVEQRTSLRPLRLLGLALANLMVTIPLAGIFMYPYVGAAYQDPGANALPEVQWFTDFPTLFELASAPTVPIGPEESLLASLSRVIPSSWSADWAFNPLHQRALPLVLGLVALVLGLKRWRSTAFWLMVFGAFYVLTWGPFLKFYDQPGANNFVLLGGEYTVRLPFTWAFKYVPVMSRLFAPYRMGCMVMLALMVLAALNLSHYTRRLRPWKRGAVGLIFLMLYFGQYFLDPLVLKASGQEGFGKDRGLPVFSSEIEIHPYFEELSEEQGKLGLVHLPLMLQQDLLTYYQTIHGKKVLLQTGWANPGALPPTLRYAREPKGETTPYLQYLLSGDQVAGNTFVDALLGLNQAPHTFNPYGLEDLSILHQRGYRYILLHERGCYLLRPDAGNALYRSMRKKLIRRFGEPLKEIREFTADETYENTGGHVASGVQLGWVSVEPSLIPSKRPLVYRLSVFRIENHVVPLPVIEEADKEPDSAYHGGLGGVPEPLGGEVIIEELDAGAGMKLLEESRDKPPEGLPR